MKKSKIKIYINSTAVILLWLCLGSQKDPLGKYPGGSFCVMWLVGHNLPLVEDSLQLWLSNGWITSQLLFAVSYQLVEVQIQLLDILSYANRLISTGC